MGAEDVNRVCEGTIRVHRLFCMAVYMIACHIRIIYFLIGIDISENFYDKDGSIEKVNSTL